MNLPCILCNQPIPHDYPRGRGHITTACPEFDTGPGEPDEFTTVVRECFHCSTTRPEHEARIAAHAIITERAQRFPGLRIVYAGLAPSSDQSRAARAGSRARETTHRPMFPARGDEPSLGAASPRKRPMFPARGDEPATRNSRTKRAETMEHCTIEIAVDPASEDTAADMTGKPGWILRWDGKECTETRAPGAGNISDIDDWEPIGHLNVDFTDTWMAEGGTPFVIYELLDRLGGSGFEARIVAIHGEAKARTQMLGTLRNFIDDCPVECTTLAEMSRFINSCAPADS